MVFGNFQQHDLFILIPSLACIVFSILLYVYHRPLVALVLLVLGAFGLRLFMAHLDPYLWDWDERFHALVAKNLLHHPLKPTLYDHPILPYDFKEWNKNHIWLHKQPLALWQMALSFALFGVNQFSARIPMVVEGTLLVWLIYRVGTITINKNAGYLAALLYSVSSYALNYMTGGEATDHVDYALVFYVSVSLWTFIEYRQSPKAKWLLLTGIFGGLAVMSKWTIGLLVFPAWGIVVLTDKQQSEKLISYFNIFKTFIISVIVFLPWQIYCYIKYPIETRYEMQYNQSHLLTEVDGRGETKWYYLQQLAHNYGQLVPFIIGFALLLSWRYIKRKDYKVFIFSSLIIPYFIFSVVAATKMPAYCYIACLAVVLMLGSVAWYAQQFIEGKKWRYSKLIVTVLLVGTVWFSINLQGIAKIHSGFDQNNIYRIRKVQVTDYFREVAKKVPVQYVIFGALEGWEVEMMFYTGNTCYSFVPGIRTYKLLKSEGLKMAVVKNKGTPAYLLNDNEVIKLSPAPIYMGYSNN